MIAKDLQHTDSEWTPRETRDSVRSTPGRGEGQVRC